MVEERLYIVTYDISDDRRWRRVFKLMHGYGRWLQLSVFQCRLSAQRRVELARRLEAAIHAREDHVLILDLGPADKVDPRVESLGKSFRAGDAGRGCDMICLFTSLPRLRGRGGGRQGARRCRASAPAIRAGRGALAAEEGIAFQDAV
jgi:CRISPR-associated protein Cas2